MRPLRRQIGMRAALVLVAILGVVAGSIAGGAKAIRPNQPAPVAALRTLADHYRRVTWQYERAAHVPRSQTSFSYRRSSDRRYLRWTVDMWTRRAYVAQHRAIIALHQKLAVTLPAQPGLRAPLRRTLGYSKQLTLSLHRIYPGSVTRQFASAHRPTARATLRLWQDRSAAAAIAVAEHAVRRARIASSLLRAFLCIHRYEGAWNSNTGNGYYGGLQMDRTFMSRYGGRYMARWGTADHWPAWAQLDTAARAHDAGRGFWPWPNTARACGLI
jgi:hypothetical protein